MKGLTTNSKKNLQLYNKFQAYSLSELRDRVEVKFESQTMGSYVHSGFRMWLAIHFSVYVFQ